MKQAMLAGVARVAPDVLTFATPVFTDCEGKYFTQQGRGDTIDGFDVISIGEEIQPLSAILWTSAGQPCIHGFEIAEGEFLFGGSRRLAHFLGASESQWRGRPNTAASVRRFISTVEREARDASTEAQPLIRAFARSRVDATDLLRGSMPTTGVALEPPTVTERAPLTQKEFLAAAAAVSREELRVHCTRFAAQLGFDAASVLLVMDQGREYGEFLTLQDKPIGHLEAFPRRWIEKRDPVQRKLKQLHVPFAWDRQTYAHAGAMDLWDEQARMGYCTGLAVATHQPGGRHLLLGFDRERPLPTSEAELTRMLADFHLLAVYIQQTVVRLLAPALDKDHPARLTPREREVLQWTAQGKSAWAVGEILLMSESTVQTHLRNVKHKLGSVSKHQAIIRAVQLGLIDV